MNSHTQTHAHTNAQSALSAAEDFSNRLFELVIKIAISTTFARHLIFIVFVIGIECDRLKKRGRTKHFMEFLCKKSNSKETKNKNIELEKQSLENLLITL